MRINVAIPEAHVDAPVLDSALESVTRLNESMLSQDQIPTFEKGLRYGVKWKPEPPGQEHFDHALTVLGRKWGDCDDLAPWHAASLRHTGEDPGANAVVVRTGPSLWHAVVKRSDGSIDDPSKRAGMGQHNSVRGAWLPLMSTPQKHGVSGAYIIRPQIALRPMRGAMQARADLPWHWREHLADTPTPTDYAMTALHTAPVSSTSLTGMRDAAAEALCGAIEGICRLGMVAGFTTDEHVSRLCAIADACEGMGRDELAEVYGDEDALAATHVVGSFFSHLNPMHALSSITHNPFAHMMANFIPGGGSALDLANMAMPGGGGPHMPMAPGAAIPRVCFPSHAATFG